MSEHLQFTPISPGTSPVIGQPAGGTKAGLPSLLDVFAALLDGHAIDAGAEAAALFASSGASLGASAAPPETKLATQQTVDASAEATLTGLVTLGIPALETKVSSETGMSPATGVVRETGVAVNADASAETAADPQVLLADLADALVALDTALQSGQPPDPALLEHLNETVDTLARVLGLSNEDKPQLVEPLGAVAGLAATVLAPTLAPIVAAAVPIVSGAVEAATPDVVPPPVLTPAAEKITDIAERLEPANPALAAKLTELAEKLGSGKIAPDLVAKLGLTADTPPDPRLEASIQALIAAKPAAPQATSVHPFGSPALALPEGTVLSARKAGDAPAPAQSAPLDIEAKPTADAPIGRPTAPERPLPNADQSTPGPLTPLAAATAANAEVSADPAATTQSGTSSLQPLPAIATHAGVKAQHAAYQAPQLNLPQLAFEMVRQMQGGNSRFQIRLDPPDLGRIDVRMDIDNGGNLNARLTVERAETLDLLQRDQRALERALAQAGIDTAKTNLEFSLKQNPFERPQGGAFADALPGGGGPAEPVVETTEVTAVTLYRGAASAGGVNIFV